MFAPCATILALSRSILSTVSTSGRADGDPDFAFDIKHGIAIECRTASKFRDRISGVLERDQCLNIYSIFVPATATTI